MCENLVELAVKHNVVLIPFGGGTNVTHALSPPDEEKRLFILLPCSFFKKKTEREIIVVKLLNLTLKKNIILG